MSYHEAHGAHHHGRHRHNMVKNSIHFFF